MPTLVSINAPKVRESFKHLNRKMARYVLEAVEASIKKELHSMAKAKVIKKPSKENKTAKNKKGKKSELDQLPKGVRKLINLVSGQEHFDIAYNSEEILKGKLIKAVAKAHILAGKIKRDLGEPADEE